MKTCQKSTEGRKEFKKFLIFLFLFIFTIVIAPVIAGGEEFESTSKTGFELEGPIEEKIVGTGSKIFRWDKPKNLEKQKIKIFENVRDKRVVETPPEKLDNPKMKNTFEIWKDMIKQADDSILIETKYIRYYHYPNEINSRYMELIEALQRSAVEGVEIKILSPDSDEELRSFSNHPRISLRETVDTHSKLLIVDTENLYVGSANWSGTGTVEKNREVGLHISNEKIVQTYRKVFSSGWTKAGGDEIKDADLKTTGGIEPTGRGAGMSNEVEKISEAELEMIRKAENEVLGYYYHFSNSRALDEYEQTLINAGDRGVQVKLLFNEISEGRRVRLSHENILIRKINLGGFRHAHPKMLIVDNKRAHLCSANWTSGSHVGEGREIGAEITYQKLVGDLSHVFYTDWNSEYVEDGERSEDFKIDRICKNRPVIERSLSRGKDSYEIEDGLHEGDYYWKMVGYRDGEQIISEARSFEVREQDKKEYRKLLKFVLPAAVIVVIVICLIYWKAKSQ